MKMNPFFALLAALLTGVILGYVSNRKTAGAKKKRRKTSNIVLLSLGIFAFAFIVTMTIIFCVKGSVPDTLITYVLGAGGIEALALAGIKVAKTVKGEKDLTNEEE